MRTPFSCLGHACALSWLILLLPLFAQTSPQTREAFDFNDLETGSDEFGSYSLGHNLSTNSRTLKRGQTSVGSMYIAHGLTNEFSIGVSPFVFSTFEMFNLMLRHGFQLAPDRRLSVDFAYFKTFGNNIQTLPSSDCLYNPQTGDLTCGDRVQVNGFQMEAAKIKLTFSQQVTGFYRFNTTASYFHYWDERSPFSFRMDPANSDDYALNLTTLNEFRLTENFFVNYELGLWGVNYTYPYLHTGLSLGLQSFSFLLSLGASTTYSFSFPEEALLNFPAGYTSRSSLHPEFEIQYFF
jgi:hypothetical protein